VNTYCSGKLSKPCERLLNLSAGSHKQVCVFINNHNYKWHEFVPFERVKFTRKELLVILLNVSYMGKLEEVVAGIHLNCKRFKSIDNLLSIGNNSLFCIGKFCQEVVLNLCIEREFNLLRVHKHELHLGWMLRIKKRSYYCIKTYRFTLTGCTGNQKVGHLGKVKGESFIRYSSAENDR